HFARLNAPDRKARSTTAFLPSSSARRSPPNDPPAGQVDRLLRERPRSERHATPLRFPVPPIQKRALPQSIFPASPRPSDNSPVPPSTTRLGRGDSGRCCN